MADIKILNQFSLSDDAVVKDVQFFLKAPLGRIPKEQRPLFGEVIISDMEAGIFQLCTGDNFFDLEIVNQQHKKLFTDLLYRGLVCLAEVMTFHDLTEADDVRGVVILYAAFFRKGFRMAGGMEINISSGVLESLRKKGFSPKPEDIRENFMVDVGDKISRFMYSQGQSSQDDEGSTGDYSDGTQKAFRLFGKKYAVDVVIEESKGFEYLAAKRVVFRPRKPDSINALKLARSELSFSDKKISPVSRILTEALTESAAYADTWERYSAMEGNFLLARARAVGVLKFERLPGLENGRTAIYIRPAEHGAADPLEVLRGGETGDSLLEVSEVPVYLQDTAMTWEQFREHEYEEGYDYLQIREVRKNERKIILETQREISGSLVLSIRGDLMQIDRRKKARDMLKSGQTPNPDIAMIVAHDLKEDNAQEFVGTEAAKQSKPHHKALSGAVMEKIFTRNRPTLTQIRAIETALNTPDIAIIQGPPGTGKTTVITAILERLNEISDKNGALQGRVLITSLQHDAVYNVIERIKINSLPTVKFGGKGDKNDLEESVKSWCDELARALAEKNPQFREAQKAADFARVFQMYSLSPTDDNAKKFLEQARTITMKQDCLHRIEEILQEITPLNSQQSSEILAMVRRLRTTKAAFADDGARNALALYDTLNDDDVMNTTSNENREVLSVLRAAALARNNPPEKELLDRLKTTKRYLLERCIPRPMYRPSEARQDITELYEEIKSEIRVPSTGANDSIDNVLFEFMCELESNPAEVSLAVQSYSYAYAATAQQSDKTDIRWAKGLRKEDADKLAEYDTVIVDEAARVNPCDLMIPVAQAKDRVILVGDHRQLPHMYDEDVFEALRDSGVEISEGDIQGSMFEHILSKVKYLSKRDGINRFVTLDEQYRMHPLLGEFASREFYEQYGEAFASPLPAENFRQQFFDVPLVWLNIPYTRNTQCVRAGTSWKRDKEAEEIARLIAEFREKDKAFECGVITFYSAQKYEIERQLKSKLGAEAADKIRVGSVDAFQGREFDVIFLSTVRTAERPYFADKANDPKLLGLGGKFSDEAQRRAYERIGQRNYGFLTSPNRLCVALTRQKNLLIVVGDSNIFAGKNFETVAEEFVPSLKHLYSLCKKKGKIIHV